MEPLSEALKLGITPGIILAVYLIVIKIIDTKKDQKQVKMTEQLTLVMNNMNNFIINFTKDIIANDKNKCEISAKDALNASSLRIVEFVIRTIVNNNIEGNKESIINNLHNTIQTEYYNLYKTLSLYTISNVNVCSILKHTWIEETEHMIINIIYNKQVDNNTKILTILSSVQSLFNTYTTYILNNGIK